MSTKKEQIKSKAIELLKNAPDGIKYSQLVNMIKTNFPNIPVNTIHGTVWNLDQTMPNEIYKPDRGLFRHTSFKAIQVAPTPPSLPQQIGEDSFYQPFANWLISELEECTKAIPLGGNRFKDKWGTPDVIGIKQPSRSDIIKPEEVVVSAEIKIDASGLITAFGQACAYKSFSHKVYLVIPENSPEEDKSRVESLCLIFGIGLILFDSSNPQNPQFKIRVRPAKHEPDMFYVNKYLKIIEKELF